jgi:hypothetical protein
MFSGSLIHLEEGYDNCKRVKRAIIVSSLHTAVISEADDYRSERKKIRSSSASSSALPEREWE